MSSKTYHSSVLFLLINYSKNIAHSKKKERECFCSRTADSAGNKEYESVSQLEKFKCNWNDENMDVTTFIEETIDIINENRKLIQPPLLLKCNLCGKSVDSKKGFMVYRKKKTYSKC